jgi:hypothetical protein
LVESTPRSSAIEKESAKLLTHLKTKRIVDIKMCYRILKGIFEQIEKTTFLKRTDTLPAQEPIF